MSPLPKHLRTRWRYLGVGLRSWPDAELARSAFQAAVWQSARSLLGDVGSARVDLRVLAFYADDGYGEAVVRTRRGEVADARAALACLSRIGDDPIGVRVRGVSGTVRGCEESYLGRQPEATRERTVVFADAERSAVRRGEEIDVRTVNAFVGATPLDLE